MRETLAQQQTATAVEKNRGRLETRTVTTTIDEQHLDWSGAKPLIRLERHTVEKGQTRRRRTYAITRLPRAKADAAFLLKHLRGRWHIENRCFYVLDTVLGDDASRTRTGHAARALNGIRLTTLNLARRLTQTVGSLCREHALRTCLKRSCGTENVRGISPSLGKREVHFHSSLSCGFSALGMMKMWAGDIGEVSCLMAREAGVGNEADTHWSDRTRF